MGFLFVCFQVFDAELVLIYEEGLSCHGIDDQIWYSFGENVWLRQLLRRIMEPRVCVPLKFNVNYLYQDDVKRLGLKTALLTAYLTFTFLYLSKADDGELGY